MAAKKKEQPVQEALDSKAQEAQHDVEAEKKEEADGLVKKEIVGILLGLGREGMEDLVAVMEEKGFFEAPASSGGGRHSAGRGGLALHSLNVCATAMLLADALLGEGGADPGFRDSLALVSLLHDLGKCGDHGMQLYVPNILKSGMQSEAKPWVRNKELSNIPHAFRSAIIAERWVDLTDEEEFAIMYHDGLYDRETGGMAIIPGHETKLMMILHWADMWASRVMEGQAESEGE